MDTDSAKFDPRDPNLAREALEAIGVDRRRMAARFTAETWWVAPAQALAITALIASPAAGIAGPMSVVAGLAAIALFGIEHLFRKRSGISTNRPAGPASLAVLIVLCVVVVSAYFLSLTLAIVDKTPWILASAGAGFMLMLIGVVIYDKAYARDLQRVR